MRLNTLSPKIKSMFLGVPKLWSASWRFERCFQLFSKSTELDGTLIGTLGKTTASPAMTLPQRVAGDTLKLTTPHEFECAVKSPMPLIYVWQYWHCKWRHCTRQSVTKDVDDAKSNNALAMVVEPSEAITRTWQVVNETHRRRSLDSDV